MGPMNQHKIYVPDLGTMWECRFDLLSVSHSYSLDILKMPFLLKFRSGFWLQTPRFASIFFFDQNSQIPTRFVVNTMISYTIHERFIVKRIQDFLHVLCGVCLVSKHKMAMKKMIQRGYSGDFFLCIFIGHFYSRHDANN